MRIALCLLLVALPVAVMVGCDDQGPDLDIESSIPVRYDSVRIGSIQEFATATGTVRAVNSVSLKAEQSGYYRLQTNPRTGRPYAMGDRVKAGEVIVALDNPEYVNQVAYDSKKLSFDISEREFTKQKSIYDKGGITLRELTDAEATYINARYSLDNAAIGLTKLQFASTFDGVITALPYRGNGQFVTTAELVVEVMNYARLFTEITLPSKELDRVQKDQAALVTAYTGETDTLRGAVTQVSPTLDPDTRMFAATVRIDNDSLLLRPGMFVRVDIVVKQKDSALVIPKEVIQETRRGKTVYVIDGGLAIERVLEIGLSNRDQVEVLSGLKEHERLVVAGFETLRDRSRVKTIN